MKSLPAEIVTLFFVAIIISIVLYYYYGGTQYIKSFAAAGSTLAGSLLNFPKTYPSGMAPGV